MVMSELSMQLLEMARPQSLEPCMWHPTCSSTTKFTHDQTTSKRVSNELTFFRQRSLELLTLAEASWGADTSALAVSALVLPAAQACTALSMSWGKTASVISWQVETTLCLMHQLC